MAAWGLFLLCLLLCLALLLSIWKSSKFDIYIHTTMNVVCPAHRVGMLSNDNTAFKKRKKRLCLFHRIPQDLINQTEDWHRRLTYKGEMSSRKINRKTVQDWLTLSGEFLPVEDASCWFSPFTFLFFLAPAPPPPPPPPPFSTPTLVGELFCWNSFSWSAHKKWKNRCKKCSNQYWLTDNYTADSLTTIDLIVLLIKNPATFNHQVWTSPI